MKVHFNTKGPLKFNQPYFLMTNYRLPRDPVELLGNQFLVVGRGEPPAHVIVTPLALRCEEREHLALEICFKAVHVVYQWSKRNRETN